MSAKGNAFDGTSGGSFVESIAVERNIDRPSGVMRIGVSPGLTGPIFDGVYERTSHYSFSDSNWHIHSGFAGRVVAGIGGAVGSTTIQGSGIARIFIRVKGVAVIFPLRESYTFEDTNMRASRFGALFPISGTNIRNPRSVVFTLSKVDDGVTRDPPTLLFFRQTEVVLNMGSPDREYTETPVVIDRIISFSAILPLTFGPARNQIISWNGVAISPDHGIYIGGRTDPLILDPRIGEVSIFGTKIEFGGAGNSYICENDGVNTVGLEGVPIFGNPQNIVELQIKLLGYRPDTEIREVKYSDLA